MSKSRKQISLMAPMLDVLHGVSYLAMGIWLGAMVMLALIAAGTFRTIRAMEPMIGAGPYSDPIYQSDATNILAGEVVGNVIHSLTALQIICACLLVFTLMLQIAFIKKRGLVFWVRAALIGLLVLILAYVCLSVHPQVYVYRDLMYDQSLPLDDRNQAQMIFQQAHRMSEQLGSLTILLLAVLMVISPAALRLQNGSETDSE